MAARFGRYIIERQLAVGGMAEVYLARQDGPAGFCKQVVIKRVLPHLANDRRFVTMFLDEARLAARLSHPNLVQIYELGDIGGAYFIAMEYVPGVSLARLARTARHAGRPICRRAAARIAGKICAALDYAHKLKGEDGKPLGLVHRDVSPDNILVTPAGLVKLIDFGVARAAGNEEGTQQAAIRGKLAYMSPEQILGQRLDRRSDIFSLGVCLYEATTLQPPFGSIDDVADVTRVVREPHRPPLEIDPDFPGELSAILDRALAKRRRDRYPRARDMQRDLESFASSGEEPIGEDELGALVREVEDLRAVTNRETSPAGDQDEPGGEPGGEPEQRVELDPAVPGVKLTTAPTTSRPARPGATATGRPSATGRWIWFLVALLLLAGLLLALWWSRINGRMTGSTQADLSKPGPARLAWCQPAAHVLHRDEE